MFLVRLVVLLALAPALALAHEQAGTGEGLVDGLLHPVLGPDHLVAMVAVGLWGAQLGRPLLTALPIAFPLMMTVGAVWALAGFGLPGVEIGIGLSAVALGLAVLTRWRAQVWVAVALVAGFAVFHGFAHGAELPVAADPFAYGIGFVTATGLLHALGIGIGWLAGLSPRGPLALRVCGAGVAAVGLAASAAALAGGA